MRTSIKRQIHIHTPLNHSHFELFFESTHPTPIQPQKQIPYLNPSPFHSSNHKSNKRVQSCFFDSFLIIFSSLFALEPSLCNSSISWQKEKSTRKKETGFLAKSQEYQHKSGACCRNFPERKAPCFHCSFRSESKIMLPCTCGFINRYAYGMIKPFCVCSSFSFATAPSI